MSQKAIILLSGGIDSAVCLAMAKAQGFECYALSIDYGQRNRYELECAVTIARQLGAVAHRTIRCDLGVWGGSALTDDVSINTYVPARNMVFLSLALSWAEACGATDLFFGANADDYENYPDCRPPFFTAFTEIAHLATQMGRCQIRTPLLHWNKARIIDEGLRLNVDFSATFSCYNPINHSQHCLLCLACRLRAEVLLT
jgi:7-cyano-7-deazaguanine synthase